MPKSPGSFAFWLISLWIRSTAGISAGAELLILLRAGPGAGSAVEVMERGWRSPPAAAGPCWWDPL